MNIRVKLFAVAKQRAGSDTLEVELPEGGTVGDLRRALVEAVPALSDVAGHLMIAVDEEYATDATPIPPEADVACIPPVSGG